MYLNKLIKFFKCKILRFNKDLNICEILKWSDSGEGYKCQAKTLHLTFIV